LKPQDVSGLNFFEMNTIQNATNNFSISNKLGQGGFGPVYKVRDFLFITSLVFSIICLCSPDNLLQCVSGKAARWERNCCKKAF